MGACWVMMRGGGQRDSGVSEDSSYTGGNKINLVIRIRGIYRNSNSNYVISAVRVHWYRKEDLGV